MGFKDSFANLTKKFEKLPTVGKVAIAGGAGLLLYALINRSSSSASEKQAVIYYPEASQSTLAFDTSNAGSSNYINKDTGGSSFGGGSSGSTGGSTNMGFTNNTYMESLGDDATGSNPAGVGTANTTETFDKGFTDITYNEGGIVYMTRNYADGSKDIYKDGRLIPEVNYKYIPQAAGGTRNDTKPAATTPQSTVKGAEFTDLDYELQQAQLQWGIAKKEGNTEGMAAAAALGQKLRAEGATDAGAAAVWESLNNG